MDIKDVKWIIEKSWSRDTCYSEIREEWSQGDPSYGQSLVTTLFIYDLFSGEIIRCSSSIGDHYYNQIDDKIIDLTKSQFHGESILYGHGEVVDREELLEKDDNRKRYHLFLNNVKTNADLLVNDVDKVLSLQEGSGGRVKNKTLGGKNERIELLF